MVPVSLSAGLVMRVWAGLVSHLGGARYVSVGEACISFGGDRYMICLVCGILGNSLRFVLTDLVCVSGTSGSKGKGSS